MGYIAVTLIYAYLRFYYFYNPVLPGLPPWSIVERFLTVPWLIMNYLKLIIFPVSLSADYAIAPVGSLSSLKFLVPAMLLVLLFTIGVGMKTKEKGIAFGVLFYLITLFPVSNIIILNNPFAQRYLYIPATGLIISAGFVVGLIFDRFNSGIKTPGFIVLLLVIIGTNSFIVVQRNAVWRDDYSLWFDTVRKVPNSARGHFGLGETYYHQGRLDEAIDKYKTALSLRPGYSIVHYKLGLAYQEKGMLDEAAGAYSIILRLDPKNIYAHNNLGNVYLTLGRFDKAIEEYMMALGVDPDFAEAHLNLGSAYAIQGRFDEAICDCDEIGDR